MHGCNSGLFVSSRHVKETVAIQVKLIELSAQHRRSFDHVRLKLLELRSIQPGQVLSAADFVTLLKISPEGVVPFIVWKQLQRRDTHLLPTTNKQTLSEVK
jgi:hypothetical protein